VWRVLIDAALTTTVTLEDAFELHPQAAVRPEPFGALVYHYGNRRLVFLRKPEVVAVVNSLADHATVADTLRTCGVAERRWPTFLKALSGLANSEVIRAR
jgi:mycofactocin biosynthesis protein MftB